MFNGADGSVREFASGRSAAQLANHTLQNLHEGLFAGPLLRWLYFLSGLAGTAMIATGLVLWTAKRRAHAEREECAHRFGLALVERLNVGTIVGLPVGIAAYFWANRLIPVDLPGRGDWEVHVLFLAWAAMLGHAFVRSPHRAWVEQLWAAAALFALLPILNAFTTESHLGVTLAQGEWRLAGVDLVFSGVGLAFGAAACFVQTRGGAAPVRRDISCARLDVGTTPDGVR